MHLIVLVDVTGVVVFLVGDVNGDINFLVGNDNDGVVFLVGDAVYDLVDRVGVPDGISHNTAIYPPLPPEKLHTSFSIFNKEKKRMFATRLERCALITIFLR